MTAIAVVDWVELARGGATVEHCRSPLDQGAILPAHKTQMVELHDLVNLGIHVVGLSANVIIYRHRDFVDQDGTGAILHFVSNLKA